MARTVAPGRAQAVGSGGHRGRVEPGLVLDAGREPAQAGRMGDQGQRQGRRRASIGPTVATIAAGREIALTLRPAGCVFVILCFEGPDRYALAGGLGSRVSGLTEALARAGATTHLYFVGDPGSASREERLDGRLVLHRWGQWISRYYPNGVYDGENEKLYDFNETVPWDVVGQVAEDAVSSGKRLIVLGEDWHSAEALCRISDLLYGRGWRSHATLMWNANNPMGFDRVNWGRLGYVANLTTVSRYMKHYMWGLGQNPMVIPNGIPEALVAPVPEADIQQMRAALRPEGAGPLFAKVARWDPDKRWNMAVWAIGALRREGVQARLLAKGGIEPHQREVFANAVGLGLSIADVRVPERPTVQSLAEALRGASGADIINLQGYVPTEQLQVLYASSDVVLANSGMEPFGLVGLEAMAAGSIVFTGATGEDYARPLQNAIVLETDDAGEIARYWYQLQDNPELQRHIRGNARQTATEYTWPAVLSVLFHRLDYLAAASPR